MMVVVNKSQVVKSMMLDAEIAIRTRNTNEIIVLTLHSAFYMTCNGRRGFMLATGSARRAAPTPSAHAFS